MIRLPSSIDKPISPDVSLSNPFSIRNCARWTSPYSSRPPIVIVHSIAASLKSAIFMKLSWLMFLSPLTPDFLPLSTCLCPHKFRPRAGPKAAHGSDLIAAIPCYEPHPIEQCSGIVRRRRMNALCIEYREMALEQPSVAVPETPEQQPPEICP
jgi:hypothetical protein